MADEDLVRGDAPLFPPDVPAHDTLAAARIAGYGWDEINAHVGQRTNMALGAGYTQGEVDRHLGWPDPSFFNDYTQRGWEQRLSNKPELAGALLQQDPAPMLSGSWIRQDYADALVAGHAKDPLDFSRKYVGAYLEATGEVEGPATQERAAEASVALAQSLPSHNEAVDYALAMTAAAGLPITPGQIALTKANLLDHWAATGSGPEKTYTEALGNADLRDRLTTPQRLVSTILKGTLTAAQFFKGAGEGAAAGFTGDESLRDRAKDMSRAEAGGAALGLLPGLLLSPVYAGAKGLDQAVNEGIVDYDAAAKGAGAIMFLKPGWTPSTPVRVFDPIKAPGEAVREAPLSQALAPIEPAAYELSTGAKVAEPIGAYHASPHDFEKFDSSKIDTGEGSQQEGHGLYFAENPEVHAEYVAQFEGKDWTIDGVRVDHENPVHVAAMQASLEGREKAIETFEYAKRYGTFSALDEKALAVLKSDRELPSAELQDYPSHSYKVQLHLDPEQILHRDLPINEQPQPVQAAIAKVHAEAMKVLEKDLPPEDSPGYELALKQHNLDEALVKQGESRAGKWLDDTRKILGDKETSELLQKEGVQAFKYFDAGSKLTSHDRANMNLLGREIPKPTHNYVVLRDEAIKLTEKNGLPFAENATPAEKMVALRQEPGAEGKTFSELAAGQDKETVELAKGYDAATALLTHLNPEMYGGFSLDRAVDGFKRIFNTRAQLDNAAKQAEYKAFIEGTVRQFRGMSDRDVAQMYAQVEPLRAAVNDHLGDYTKWLRMGPMRPIQKPLIADLIDYMEGRSVGATLDPNSNFMGVANALRGINERMRQEIEVHAPEFDSFYQDYYRHLWVNAKDADAAFGVGRQGSGRSLNERTIPTVSEGIDRGLMPKILDPIENTLHYAAGMSSYLAARRVLQASRDAGYVKYGVNKPEPGWMRLEGMKSTLPAGDNGIQFAWAPPGFAKSYNNWVDQGFHRWEIGGKIYDSLQRAANVMTGFKLALSGYHAVNIIKETGTAELTNGIGEISRGDLTNGLRDMGFGATILPGTVDYLKKGAAYQKKFLDPLSTDPVVDLLTQAGFNPLSRSHRYGGVSSPDISNINRGPTIYQMLSRHTFKWQMAEEAKAVMGTAEEAAGYRTVMAGPRAVGFMANQVGRVLNAFNSPVFDQLVPKVKAAAAADEMEAWLRGNPTAGREEQLSVARKLVDSMDDRFGEMNQDNLFWNKMVKQTLNLFTVSMGWEYGTLRAFGGAAKDILSGDLGSTRARWMLAYPAMIGITSAMYQYLHTGEAPQSPMDLILPRTGGKTPDGLAPERALAPGYEKDVLQWYKAVNSAPNFMGGVGNVASLPLNKLNPFWAAIRTTATGEDSMGRHVAYEPHPPFEAWGLPPDMGNFLRYLAKEVTPIPVESIMERPKHTGISDAERLLGYRAPSIFFENRELFDQRQKAREYQLKKQEFRRDLREKAKIE